MTYSSSRFPEGTKSFPSDFGGRQPMTTTTPTTTTTALFKAQTWTSCNIAEYDHGKKAWIPKHDSTWWRRGYTPENRLTLEPGMVVLLLNPLTKEDTAKARMLLYPSGDPINPELYWAAFLIGEKVWVVERSFFDKNFKPITTRVVVSP